MKKSIILYIIFGVVLLGIGAYFLLGVRGIVSLLNTLKTLVLWSIVIGIAVYGVWYFFIRKERDDRVHLNAKRVIEQSLIYKSPFIRDLYLSGDKNHPQVRLGKIIGYSRVANVKGEQEDVFVFKRSGFPFGLFEEPKAIRVPPDKHSPLIGDVIIEGISLIYFGGFYYVNSDYLDYEKIDRTITTEIKRTTMFDMLKDWKVVIDMALGISPEHQKVLERKDLLKIPTRTAPQEEPTNVPPR